MSEPLTVKELVQDKIDLSEVKTLEVFSDATRHINMACELPVDHYPSKEDLDMYIEKCKEVFESGLVTGIARKPSILKFYGLLDKKRNIPVNDDLTPMKMSLFIKHEGKSDPKDVVAHGVLLFSCNIPSLSTEELNEKFGNIFSSAAGYIKIEEFGKSN